MLFNSRQIVYVRQTRKMIGKSMRILLPLLLLATVFIAGCSTRANPVNWFDNDPPEKDNFTDIEETNPLIPEDSGSFFQSGREERERYKGVPINRVTEVKIERVPGGVIIKARGLAETQGVYAARLTPANPDEVPEDGVIVYRLEARNNPEMITQGPEVTREVIVGRKRTIQELGGARRIRVESATNALEARL